MKKIPARMRVPIYAGAAVLIAVLGGVLLMWALLHADFSFGHGRNENSIFADIYFITVPVLCILCAFGDRMLYPEWYKSSAAHWRLLRGLAIMLTVLICYFAGSFLAVKLHP